MTILRLFNAYGPRNHLSWWGGPVVTFIESLLDGEPMEIHGDGHADPDLHLRRRHGRRHRSRSRAPESRGEVINLGGTETLTILELAERVQGELFGQAPSPLRVRFIPYESLPGKYQDVRHRVPDTTKAQPTARLRGPGLARRRSAPHHRVAP